MSPLDCWWSHASSTTNSAPSKHRAVIAQTPKSTQPKTDMQRPWHSLHYSRVGEKLLIKEGSTKGNTQGRGCQGSLLLLCSAAFMKLHRSRGQADTLPQLVVYRGE